MQTPLLTNMSADLARLQDALDAAQRQGRAAFDRLFESPPEGLTVHEINLERRIVRASSRHQTVLGYRPDEMVGQPAASFIVLHDSAERAMDKKLSGTQELKPFVRAFKRADGRPVTMLLLDRHIRDADGKVIGIRTVLTEIPPQAALGS
jgi:PAS domain S-box-containing protein